MRESEIIKKLLEIYEKTPKHDEGYILGSMTTRPDNIAVYAYNLFIHTNAGDTRIFPSLEYFRKEIIDFMKKLYGECTGFITSGGTESNIIALYVAREKTGRKLVIAPKTVHHSIIWAAHLLGMKIVFAPVTSSHIVDINSLHDIVEKRKDEVAAIVVTAGTTEWGSIDPVREVSEIARQYNIYLHVDAAYGGLFIPALYEKGYIDTHLRFYEGVTSISVDFHKNGLSPIPSGLILFKNEELLSYARRELPYTLGKYQYGLLGTRPGGSIAAIWAVIKKYGIDGYSKIALRCMKTALYLYNRLTEFQEIIVWKPILPIVVFKSRHMSSEKLLEELVGHGYYVYRAPSVDGLRIVVMPHVTTEHIDRFINTLSEILGEKTE
ncbi:MAG: tyrosine decarboxylase MfnA [Crenarchaeota archaeon]|nr:tyrosine decarboxylase MfnA [Thermoproteota archaeon]